MKRHIRTTIRFIFIGGAIAAVLGVLWILSIFRSLPSPELIANREVRESTKIFDRTGEVLLYEIYDEEKRTVIPFEEIPHSVKHATIAIEDANFYTHSAVDFKSILRALFVNIKRGGIRQGGSTITQQLAKNAFLTDERTLTRKLKELVLAFSLERNLTKDQILDFYLNQIPYGSNAYGIETASQVFFGKSASDLSLAESALLVSLPKAPSYYSPWGSHVKELLARKNNVLDAMAREGLIGEEARDAAKKEELVFKTPSVSIQAPHFVIAVQEYLNDTYGEDFVRGAGLRVTTTLDWKLQQVAEKVVKEGAERNEELYKGTNAALVAQDATSGEILALVGSRDYFDIEHEGNFNVATQGLRQPGSSIKPLVYLTALERGYTPDTLLFDLETEFDATGRPEKSYKPNNFDGVFRGPITLRNSLAQSINVTSVKTLYLAGLDNVLKNAAKLGITTFTDRYRYGLSLVLGGGEVRLVELVGAYSVFAQEGIRHPQRFLKRVETSDGIVFEESSDVPKEVIDPQYPRIINDILSDIDARRPLFSASLDRTIFPGHQVALKTGTTNDYRDAWAMGYTRSLVVGVWAGNNNNEPMQRRGGSILAAVPIWSDFMREALKERTLEPFTRPEPIVSQKPVLNGSYVTMFEAQGILYPQVHDILFYVNKNNPDGPMPVSPESDNQFANWEGPVLAWAQTNVPGFAEFNKPLPSGSVLAAQTTINPSPLPQIRIDAPQNGSFIQTPFELRAHISAPQGIARIQTYFNGTLLKEDLYSASETTLDYHTTFSPPAVELQNVVRFVVYDRDARKEETQLILFH